MKKNKRNTDPEYSDWRLKGMANLNLIRIQKNKPTNEFSELLKKLRKNVEPTLSFDEITKEVEAVRGKRYKISRILSRE